MEKNETSLLPILEEDLKEYKVEITNYLKKVQWRSDQRKLKTGPESIDLSFLMHAGKALDVNHTDELSLLKNAVRISDDRTVLSNSTNAVLNLIRKGYCIGRHVAFLYEKASGLEHLKNKDHEGNLHQSELPEFHQKLQSQSAILLFVAGLYIKTFIAEQRVDEVESINIDFGGIPEVSLTRPSKAIQCSLFYFTAYVERSKMITTDLHLLKITALYFDRLIDEVLLRKDSLQFINHFTESHYKLENSSFVIQGFENGNAQQLKGIVFNNTRMEDIVANKEAKHMFKRYAERLMCFDFEAKKNPFLELGGLPSITMADGKPGTGKSMLIAATATLIKEKCDLLGYPFLFWPLPENIISTYQGGSAERAIEWFKPMQGTDKIIFAPVDDAENNLEERTRQGVSAGVREFIGVFLRNTEGAYAVNNGNRMISLFTNIPDQVDKAVLSRIQVRIPIDGASEFEDFVDQDYLWWKKYQELDASFIDAENPKDYTYLSAQKSAKSLSALYNQEYEFTNSDIKAIYEEVAKKYSIEEHAFFGHFYDKVQEQFGFFSSRDLRNIQKTVDARITDFDLPEEWWEKPELFFTQPYDVKLEKLKTLMKENLGGLSFSAIRLREAVFYIETAIRINETGVHRKIDETAEQLLIQEKARIKLRENDRD